MAYGSPRVQRFYYAAPRPVQEVMTSIAGLRRRHQVRGRFFDAWFTRLVRAQFGGRNEQERHAWEQLKRILDCAYRETAFYRRRFEQLGLRPDDIQSPGDLARLPLLTKEEVREHAAELISRRFHNQRGAQVVHTSGTTGKALSVWISQECFEREYAYRGLHYSWAGVSLDDRLAMFAGHPVVHVDHQKPPFWRHDWAGNRLLFSSQHLFPKFAPLYVQALQTFRADVIHGYPSTLAWVAQAVLEYAPARIRPRAVFTGAETLLPHQRTLIEQAFGCKVYNWYGNSEHLACITECPSSNLHVQMEHSWVEFLDDTGNPVSSGKPAKLVATTLCNQAMPLIRYVVGDVVTPADGACPCGRHSPLVQAIEGRVEDYVIGAQGRVFGRLDHIFKDATAVAEAQLLQDEPGALTIRLVKRSSYTDRDTDLILAAARFRLGSDFRISLDFVDKIPRTSNGKFQFIRSSIRNESASPQPV